MKRVEIKSTTASQTLQTKSEDSNGPFFDNEGGKSVLNNVSNEPHFFDHRSSNTNQETPFFSKPFVQTKLTIGHPGDKYEQQADAMADQVVQRLTENENSSPLSPAVPTTQPTPVSETSAPQTVKSFPQTIQQSLIQKKCAECKTKNQELKGADEKTLQMKPIFESDELPAEKEVLQRKCEACEREEMPLQSKWENQAPHETSSDLESKLRSSKGSGSPLSIQSRTQMESAFESDFSGVRIHTDSTAVQMNESLGAKAFTHGNDIYFNSGNYKEDSKQGKHLLAHELTHVIQQEGGDLKPKIQRSVFGNELTFEPIPGPFPRVRLHGPYSDEAIAEELYGDYAVPIRHDPQDHLIIHIEEIRLLDHWRPYFNDYLVEQDEVFQQYTAEQRAQAGAFALGTTLNNSSEVVEIIRNLYNNGVAEIVSERARMIRQVLPSQQADDVIRLLASNLDRREMVRVLSDVLPEADAARIADRVATMRHQLALNVRIAGGNILRKGAELLDTVRRQGRPTYDSLRAQGKTNAQIIASATRTNHFVNRLPSGMRVAGKGFWLASAGISIYIILSADPDERARVAREEVGAFIGGAAGTAAFSGLCIATGIATGGLGLVACGVLGGLAGGMIGRNPMRFLQLLDIAPHTNPQMSGRMFRLQGDYDVSDFFIFSIVHRRVTAAERVLVIGTGLVSGSLTGGRGHFRRYQVIAANAAAEELFGGTEPQWIPNYILHPVTADDLMAVEETELGPNQVQRKKKSSRSGVTLIST